MRTVKLLSSLTLFLLATFTGTVLAGHGHGGHGHHHGGHMSFGFYMGAPYAYPFYPSPYYYPPAVQYYPPIVVSPVPVQPPIYIEQQQIRPGSPQAIPEETHYWYRCEKTDAYYPYVKECPGGWQKVVPIPPSQP